MTLVRCRWAEGSDIERAYHDAEWGVPLHGDAALFEMLTLEGAQAGLSWRQVLARRAHYRRAFLGFDIAAVAAMPDAALDACLADPGLIRNRLKIASVRANARAALTLAAAPGGLDRFLWSFVDGRPLVNRPAPDERLPARTERSDAMSKALRAHGFRFVGSTICYAFMQATGMVDDHMAACFRASRAAPAAGSSGRPPA